MTISIDAAVQHIRTQSQLVPELCLVLGSGLGDLANAIDGVTVDYDSIPGFPKSTAPSHAGQLVLGHWHGRAIVAMQGRVHAYEGYTAAEVTFPMRVMAALGATIAVLTNAAGGLGKDAQVGDLVAIEDHLSLANLTGADPLRGPNDDALGPRFLSTNRAYEPDLITLAVKTAKDIGETLRTGTYAFVTGPTFETPAEVRMLQMLGCHLIGMSTVPEVLAARHMGLKVLAISAVTNLSVSSIHDTHITNEEEVWDAVKHIRPRLAKLLEALIPRLHAGP